MPGLWPSSSKEELGLLILSGQRWVPSEHSFPSIHFSSTFDATAQLSLRPNVIWIVTTQWRYSATGYRGDVDARTPCLDNLAARSTDYVQAVTPHPMGPQARASLLTGKLSPQSGVIDYWDRLPIGQKTVAHALRAQGYTTGFFGKWHLGKRSQSDPFVSREAAKIIVPPEDRGGFDLWEGFEGGFQLNDPWLHGTRISLPTLFKGYQSDVLVQRALEWVTGEKLSPYFCVLSLESPHPPYHASTPHAENRNPSTLSLRPNVPLGGEIEKKARDELSGYYAHIDATDHCIGKLIAGINLDSTIVVFTSVHGDMHGSHGVFRKAWPYEESVRVPLLVSNLRPETKTRQSGWPVSLVDLSHMTLAWAEGREWQCVRDSALISMPTAMTIPLQCNRGWRGFRSPRRKLILNSDGGPWLYFNLEQDPFELKNLVGEPSAAAEIDRARQLL